MRIHTLIGCTLLLFFTATTQASTLSADDYHFSIEQAAEGDDSMRKSMASYLQGIGDTLQEIADMEGEKLAFRSIPSACLPSDKALNIKSIARAIQSQIGSFYAPINMDRYADYSVPRLAVMGLSEEYPCD